MQGKEVFVMERRAVKDARKSRRNALVWEQKEEKEGENEATRAERKESVGKQVFVLGRDEDIIKAKEKEIHEPESGKKRTRMKPRKRKDISWQASVCMGRDKDSVMNAKKNEILESGDGKKITKMKIRL